MLRCISDGTNITLIILLLEAMHLEYNDEQYIPSSFSMSMSLVLEYKRERLVYVNKFVNDV